MADLTVGSLIHPLSVVDPTARIAPGVVIGPYSVIGGEVEIEEGCWIGPHVVIQGLTRIGKNNRIFQFASLGAEPQDKKYNAEPTAVEIGSGNTIREYVTINRGTIQDDGVTRIGKGNWIMAYVHIAHDCRIGNSTVLANNATLAGHVRIDDFVTLGGATLIHQFCHIGEHAFTAYGARINKDVPPFMMVGEGKAHPRGLNVAGLKRRGFSEERLQVLKEAYRILYRSDLSLELAIEQLRPLERGSADAVRLREFLERAGRSIVR